MNKHKRKTLRIRGVPGRTLLGCCGGWFDVLELDVLLWVACFDGPTHPHLYKTQRGW